MEKTTLIGIDINEKFYMQVTDGSGSSTIPKATGPSAEDAEIVAGETVKELNPQEVVVDVEKYYGKNCCIRVIGVESKLKDGRLAVDISPDGKKVIYEGDMSSELWTCHEKDSFEYCVEDTHTGEKATATITLSGVKPNDEFKAADICVEIDGMDSSLLRLRTGVVNKYNDVSVVSFGAYDEGLIENVAVDPLDDSMLLIKLNRDCSAWEKVSTSTTFSYTIASSEFVGEKAFGCITVQKSIHHYPAIDIVIEVTEPLPDTILIDVAEHYRDRGYSGELEVVGFADVDEDRGVPSILDGAETIYYTFNKESGFWDGNEVTDVFKYTKEADTDTDDTYRASAYVIIKKCVEETSGSGSESGSIGGSSYYLEDSNATINLSGVIAGEGTINQISGIVLENIPGTHVLDGPVVSKIEDRGTYTELNFSGGTIDGMLPASNTRLYITHTAALADGDNSVQLLAESPVGDRSYITMV
jgi:hypothetical protein